MKHVILSIIFGNIIVIATIFTIYYFLPTLNNRMDVQEAKKNGCTLIVVINNDLESAIDMIKALIPLLNLGFLLLIVAVLIVGLIFDGKPTTR